MPQDSDNNQDTWFTFETYQRELCRKCKSVEVISGPVFEPQPDKTLNPKAEKGGVFTQSYKVLGKNGIAVPTHLYKIIKCNLGDGNSYASAFLFKNGPSKDNQQRLQDFAIPLSELSGKTGLQFNLNSPGSLVEYDFPTLSSLKEDYDKQVLYPRLFRASSYDSLSDELRKVRAHKITETSPVLSNKVEELLLSKQEPYEKLGACDRVSKYLWIRKDLAGNGLVTQQTKDEVDRRIHQNLEMCTDPKKLQKIEKTLERSKDNRDTKNDSLLRRVKSMFVEVAQKQEQPPKEPPKSAEAA